jgi:hypothetical protein
MSRPAAFQRSMARLALLAMLSLALLPGIGRIAQSSAHSAAVVATPFTQPLLGAICTTRGLAYDARIAATEAIDFALDDPTDAPIPATPLHPEHDCDYCALTAFTTVPAAVALPGCSLHAGAATDSLSDRRIQWHYPLGLGSRGPPLTA